jgi:Uma2 family endonuclease
MKRQQRLDTRDVFQGDVRVQRDENFHDFDKPKPDVVVRCGPLDPEADGLNYLVDPVVVVEVLSPGTTDVDRGPKLAFFQSLPALQHIVIAYQDQVRIEPYRRDGDGWTMSALHMPQDVLVLSAIGFQMTVAEAYFNVQLDG